MDYKQFLNKEGLAHFNHILNERFQGRLKYVDEFERLGLHAKSKHELYEFIESKMADMPENAKIDNDK